MAWSLSYISAVSLLVNQNYAQTGQGCFSQTCATPGQVRIDAIIERGQFVGGCNCACEPSLFDMSSPNFCAEPNQVNFDARTLSGDCSCGCDPAFSVDPASCVFPTTYIVDTCACGCPSWAPPPSSCRAPTEFVPDLCQCACPGLGSVGGPCIVQGQPVMGSMVRPDCTCDGGQVVCLGNQEVNPLTGACECPEISQSGAWYPVCNYPLVRDPETCDCTTTTTTLPPQGPIEVMCAGQGQCSCPYGTQGTCSLTCDGASDACKDGRLSCADGYDCIVNCVAGSACAGSTVIMGPANAALTVNCLGTQSCEGSVVINNREGTDTSINCAGGQSCKGAVSYSVGMRAATIACSGMPDSCQGGNRFILPHNLESTPGASFQCTGANCPPNAPAPFSNPGTAAPVPAPPSTPLVPAPTIPAWMPTIPQSVQVQPINNFLPAQTAPAPTVPLWAQNTMPTIPDPRAPKAMPISIPAPLPAQPQPIFSQPIPAPANPALPAAPVWDGRPSAPIPMATVPTFPRPPAPGTGAIPAPITNSGQGGSVMISKNAPIPLIIPDEILICEGPTCQCSGTQSCTIKCAEADSCKDALLICSPDHDCTVVCMEKACGKATVTGPIGHSFTMLCEGDSACMDAKMNANEAYLVSYTCGGKDACKGAGSKLNCGTGPCYVDCSGPSSCNSGDINPNTALSFDCYGRDAPCPRSYTAAPAPQPTMAPTDPCFGLGDCPCSFRMCFEQRDPDTCECYCPFEVLLAAHRGPPEVYELCGKPNSPTAALTYIDSGCACDCPLGSMPVGGCPSGQRFNDETCACECPGMAANGCAGASTLNPNTCQCECPTWAPKASDCLALNKVLRDCECQCPIPCAGPGQIQSSSSCRCGCPFTTPDPASCASGFIDELFCDCAKPLPSTHCCVTSEPGFLPWAGRCWGNTNEQTCYLVENNRCVWDENNCLPDPPVNTIDPTKPCMMRDSPCQSGADCCSEVCRVNGFCR